MIIAVNFQFKKLEGRSLKNIKAFKGIRTHDLRDTCAMLDQLSCEATHWERGQFVEFISSGAVNKQIAVGYKLHGENAVGMEGLQWCKVFLVTIFTSESCIYSKES